MSWPAKRQKAGGNTSGMEYSPQKAKQLRKRRAEEERRWARLTEQHPLRQWVHEPCECSWCKARGVEPA